MTVSYKEERNIHTGTAIVAGMCFFMCGVLWGTQYGVWGVRQREVFLLFVVIVVFNDAVFLCHI